MKNEVGRLDRKVSILIDHFFDYALMITNYSKIDEKNHGRKIFRIGKIEPFYVA